MVGERIKQDCSSVLSHFGLVKNKPVKNELVWIGLAKSELAENKLVETELVETEMDSSGSSARTSIAAKPVWRC